MNARAPAKAGSLTPFYIWLALFYLAWTVIVATGGHMRTVIEHWPMAAAMAAGSYIAGSTPMGILFVAALA